MVSRTGRACPTSWQRPSSRARTIGSTTGARSPSVVSRRARSTASRSRNALATTAHPRNARPAAVSRGTARFARTGTAGVVGATGATAATGSASVAGAAGTAGTAGTAGMPGTCPECLVATCGPSDMWIFTTGGTWTVRTTTASAGSVSRAAVAASGASGEVRMSGRAGACSSAAPPNGVRPAASWRVAVSTPPMSAVRQATSRSRSERRRPPRSASHTVPMSAVLCTA